MTELPILKQLNLIKFIILMWLLSQPINQSSETIKMIWSTGQLAKIEAVASVAEYSQRPTNPSGNCLS